MAESGSIPRNFKLLEELEKSEHAMVNNQISYGLTNAEDMSLTDWTCSIIGPNGGNFEGRFYQLKVTCGPNYPNQPPDVRFVTRINLSKVNQTGAVSGIPSLTSWNSSKSMEDVLVDLFNTMKQEQGKSQPNEDSEY